MVKPLFLKTIANARKFMMKSDLQRKLDKERNVEAARRRLYHILFGVSQSKPFFALCERFKTHFSFPKMVLNSVGKKSFNEIVSVRGAKEPVDAMIIANHRAKNLADFSPSDQKH